MPGHDRLVYLDLNVGSDYRTFTYSLARPSDGSPEWPRWNCVTRRDLVHYMLCIVPTGWIDNRVAEESSCSRTLTKHLSTLLTMT